MLLLMACGDAEPVLEVPYDAGLDEPRGLRVDQPEAQPGYALFGPLLSSTVYLVDHAGLTVHTWETDHAPACSAYLLDNGHLLRTAREPESERFAGGCLGGRIQEFTWDGELVWDFHFAADDYVPHHDIAPMPNGNVLAIAWEHKSVEESRWAGRAPAKVPEIGLTPLWVVELEPRRPDGARIVWEWHVWDHLVQNRDKRLHNYGEPSQLPGRIDINAGLPPAANLKQLEELKALGYLSPNTTPASVKADFLHTNAIDYNADLDQIVLSVRRYNELWIIDHSTTTEEAVGSTGGRWGRGGDLLYRWGNPANYGRGGANSQRFFEQHDVHWIPEGLPGAGNLLVFNNNVKEDAVHYSTVDEIAVPKAEDGSYLVPREGPFGPEEPVWSYQGTTERFHGAFVSGAQRQPNGNTLICSGPQGRLFEVQPDGEIVWELWTRWAGDLILAGLSDWMPPYTTFRATKISPEHPGLAGRLLPPLDPQPVDPRLPERHEGAAG